MKKYTGIKVVDCLQLLTGNNCGVSACARQVNIVVFLAALYQSYLDVVSFTVFTCHALCIPCYTVAG